MAPLLRKRGGAPRSVDKKADARKERSQSKQDAVVGPADVLLGRGKGAYEWQGNLRYQQIICYSLPAYTAAKKKQDKTKISNSIVAAVKAGGGRFLKETRDGTLCEVPDKEAREKVAHALRHRRRIEEGGRGPLDFSMGMFSDKNEECAKMLHAEYRDAEPDSLRSDRTEDTDPVVSQGSDRTDRYDNDHYEMERTIDYDMQQTNDHGVAAADHYQVADAPMSCSDLNHHEDDERVLAGLTESDLQFLNTVGSAFGETHFHHQEGVAKTRLTESNLHLHLAEAPISLGNSYLHQRAMQTESMDDSSFDAEVEAVADPAFSDMSSEFSLLELGSAHGSLAAM
ncbi:hypothetical protein ACA910_004376 [Epithemia clementina (nom. ined.)]